MRQFNSPFDFYKLVQKDRKHLIDQCFVEKKGKHSNGDVLYFPIGLTKEGSYHNYNRRQGVISVHPIRVSTFGETKGQKWFKVSAFSPDDFDLDLEWLDPSDELRDKIIAFIKGANKREITYQSFLEKIQSLFGGTLS